MDQPPAKFLPLKERNAYQRLEDVIGCKWSTAVLGAISNGVKRPGELERYIPGISKKVLNERLRKLGDFGVINRIEYPGLPARVDYELTDTGEQLSEIISQIHQLSETHIQSQHLDIES